jgi:hypothetical protein
MNQDTLKKSKIIAIIGLSDKPDRPSYEVASYLQKQGFRIIPINPNIQEIFGEKSYPDLLSVPKEIRIDIVDIFRKSDLVLPHVKEAIERGDIKTIWMQEGIINDEAASLARKNGLEVVMNFCLMKTHKKIQMPIL